MTTGCCCSVPFLFTQPRIAFREWCHSAWVGHPTTINVTKRILHRQSWRLTNLHSPSQACLMLAVISSTEAHVGVASVCSLRWRKERLRVAPTSCLRSHTFRSLDCFLLVLNTHARLQTWEFLIAGRHRALSVTRSRSSLAARFFVFACLVQCLVRQGEPEEARERGCSRECLAVISAETEVSSLGW